MALKVALVGRDARLRMELARAFDRAPPSWDVSLHETPPSGYAAVVVAPDVDAPDGAVRWTPDEPEGAFRTVADLISSQGRRLAVTSACGGAGVTTVALHLAAALGGSVCYFEAEDAGAGDRLGLPPERLSWDSDDITQAALPIAGGFRALLAPRDPDGTGRAAALARASIAFESVIVDAPGRRFADVLPVRAAVMVVPFTTAGARRCARMLDSHPHVLWAVAVNAIGPRPDITRMDLRRELGRAIAVELPNTPGVRDAEESRSLLTSRWSRWLQRVESLARALERA